MIRNSYINMHSQHWKRANIHQLIMQQNRSVFQNDPQQSCKRTIPSIYVSYRSIKSVRLRRNSSCEMDYNFNKTWFTPPYTIIREMAESIRNDHVTSINDNSIERVDYPFLDKHWASRFY